MENHRAWMIFDADNTLWEIEHHYDEARVALVEHVAVSGVAAKSVDEYQRERDKELHKVLGYSARRFALSFEETLHHFCPNPSAEKVEHVRQLAMNVFDQPVRLVEGLGTILDRVKTEYRLGLVTAGEQWVQERKLATFPFRDLFAVVEIVPAKTADLLRTFCLTHHVHVAVSWMVGDSAKSDVFPARDAGLGAIHVDHKRNWDLEHAEVIPWDRYHRIQHLSDILKVPGLLRSSETTPDTTSP